MGEDVALKERRLWEEAKAYVEPWHSVYAREAAFSLKLLHYLRETGETENLARVKYRGRELWSKLRRMIADVVASCFPMPLDCWALDLGVVMDQAAMEDARQQADDAKRVIEQDIYDETSCFAVAVERTIMSALAARIGVLTFDVLPEKRRIRHRFIDWRRFMLCPPYQDVFDPCLPYLIEEDVISVEQARGKTGWKNTEHLRADGSDPNRFDDGTTPDIEGQTFGDLSGREPESGAAADRGFVRVTKRWILDDDEYRDEVRPESGRALSKSDWYLGCPGCGWRGESADSDYTAELFPDSMTCPRCGAVARLITSLALMDKVRVYPEGRLVITAIEQGLVLYDGLWPFRSDGYPFMLFKCSEHMTDPAGLCHTSVDWYPQVTSNAIARRLYDETMSAPNIIVMHGNGTLTDASGAIFQPTDEPWQFAFTEEAVPSQAFHQFSAQPQTEALIAAYQVISQAFRADMGVADLGSTFSDPKRTKDVPGVTLDAMVENQNVPTDHHIRTLRRMLGPYLTTLNDAHRALHQDGTMVSWQGYDGGKKSKQVAEVPNVKVRVTADEAKKRADMEEVATIMQWADLPPGRRAIVAEAAGISPDTVRRVEEDERRAMMEGVPQVPMGAKPASPNGAGMQGLLAPTGP